MRSVPLEPLGLALLLQRRLVNMTSSCTIAWLCSWSRDTGTGQASLMSRDICTFQRHLIAGVVEVVIGRSLGGGGGGGITLRYKAASSIIKDDAELRSCVKVEVAVLGSPSLIVLMVFRDIKQH